MNYVFNGVEDILHVWIYDEINLLMDDVSCCDVPLVRMAVVHWVVFSLLYMLSGMFCLFPI